MVTIPIQHYDTIVGSMASGALAGMQAGQQEAQRQNLEQADQQARQQEFALRQQQAQAEQQLRQQALDQQTAASKARELDARRAHAGSYAATLGSHLTNPETYSYLQRNNLLQPVSDEINRALAFSSGQADAWAPKFSLGGAPTPSASSSPSVPGPTSPGGGAAAPSPGPFSRGDARPAPSLSLPPAEVLGHPVFPPTAAAPPAPPTAAALPSTSAVTPAPAPAPAPAPTAPAAAGAPPPAVSGSPLHDRLRQLLQTGPPAVERLPFETDAELREREADALRQWSAETGRLQTQVSQHDRQAAISARDAARDQTERARAAAQLRDAAERTKQAAISRYQALLRAMPGWARLTDASQKPLLAELRRAAVAAGIDPKTFAAGVARTREDAKPNFEQRFLANRANQMFATASDPKKWGAISPQERRTYLEIMQDFARDAGLALPKGVADRMLRFPYVAARRSTAGTPWSGSDNKIWSSNYSVVTGTAPTAAGTRRPSHSPAERQRAMGVLRDLIRSHGGDPGLLPAEGLAPAASPASPASGASSAPVAAPVAPRTAKPSGEPTVDIAPPGMPALTLTKQQLWDRLTAAHVSPARRNQVINQFFPSPTPPTERGALPPAPNRESYLATLAAAGARPEEMALLHSLRFGQARGAA